jgi:tRNA threonylcarbamoyladenosine biosynthesis protein TsaE
MEYITSDFLKTKELGEAMAKKIKPREKAAIFCLRGDLGAGKTTFLQGFGGALGVKKIQSPTFIIMNKHPLKDRTFRYFYHFDCFRIEDPEEIMKLGFSEIVDDPQNIIAIEWPEKIEEFLPTVRTEITFEITGETKRKIKVKDKKNGRKE